MFMVIYRVLPEGSSHYAYGVYMKSPGIAFETSSQDHAEDTARELRESMSNHGVRVEAYVVQKKRYVMMGKS